MREGLKLKGHYLITARDTKTGALLWSQRLDNLLTAINQTIRTQMLMGTYTGGDDALAIKYFAFGTGATAATVNDTKLAAEQYRKPVTQMSNPTAGVVQTVVALGNTEANFTIREIGVFAGPSASAAADSGTLMSRVVVNIEKNSNIALNIIRTDTCTTK